MDFLDYYILPQKVIYTFFYLSEDELLYFLHPFVFFPQSSFLWICFNLIPITFRNHSSQLISTIWKQLLPYIPLTIIYRNQWQTSSFLALKCAFPHSKRVWIVGKKKNIDITALIKSLYFSQRHCNAMQYNCPAIFRLLRLSEAIMANPSNITWSSKVNIYIQKSSRRLLHPLNGQYDQ